MAKAKDGGTDIGRIQKGDNAAVVVRVDEYKGIAGLTIREHIETDSYTGFTKRGNRIALSDLDEFLKLVKRGVRLAKKAGTAPEGKKAKGKAKAAKAKTKAKTAKAEKAAKAGAKGKMKRICPDCKSKKKALKRVSDEDTAALILKQLKEKSGQVVYHCPTCEGYLVRRDTMKVGKKGKVKA